MTNLCLKLFKTNFKHLNLQFKKKRAKRAFAVFSFKRKRVKVLFALLTKREDKNLRQY